MIMSSNLLSRCTTSSHELTLLRKLLVPSLVTQEYAQHLRRVVSERSSCRLILDGVSEPVNVSAIIRTAEGMGIQHVHVIPVTCVDGKQCLSNEQLFLNRHRLATKGKTSKKISRGAEAFVTVHYHPTVMDCLSRLPYGMPVYTAELSSHSKPIHEFDFGSEPGPIALALGNESNGVSKMLSVNARGNFILPIVGHTQSYNVGASAAMALMHVQGTGLLSRCRMSEKDQASLLTRWMLSSIGSRCDPNSYSSVLQQLELQEKTRLDTADEPNTKQQQQYQQLNAEAL